MCKEVGTPMGVLEIKCPYTRRNATVAEACKKAAFFCTSEIKLKKNNNYYYQVQGQMAILNLSWCDFVVWTRKDMHTERIYFDR